MIVEECRPIPGWPEYEATYGGEVISLKGASPRVLRQVSNRQGYRSVTLCRARIPTTHGVHRLVMLAFHGRRPIGMETRHLDGNPANNHRENLAYGTSAENANDRILHGTSLKGVANHRAKFSLDDVFNIRRRFSSGESADSIAGDYGTTARNIRKITNGKSYTDAPGPVTHERIARQRPRHPRAKLTDIQVAEIVSLRHTMSTRKAAIKCGVRISTVQKIWSGEIYRPVS